MTFIPHPSKIWFEPLKKDSIILNDKESLVEAGLVLGVGTEVTFVKEGDIVYFLSYGAEETPKDKEGKSYWTVADDKAFIMGKEDASSL